MEQVKGSDLSIIRIASRVNLAKSVCHLALSAGIFILKWVTDRRETDTRSTLLIFFHSSLLLLLLSDIQLLKSR